MPVSYNIIDVDKLFGLDIFGYRTVVSRTTDSKC